MDFNCCVRNVLFESPDEIGYKGTGYKYDEPTGNPHTFFITTVSVRTNVSKGYKSDKPSALGVCVVYCPTVMGSQNIDKAYLEDPENQNWTHFNLSSLLIYNKVYKYEDLKQFGMKVFSFKRNADQYFEKIKTVYPNMAFTLTKDNEEIGLKYRGRFWKIGNKYVVSLWYFDKNVIQKYLIPFFKQTYNVSEEDIVFETYQDDKDQEDARFVVGSKILGVQKQQPYEKEIASLLAQLHVASSDEQKKNQIKNRLMQIFAKYKLDPKKYGFGEEKPLKASQYFAQKMMSGAPPKETVAQVKAKQQTSESIIRP